MNISEDLLQNIKIISVFWQKKFKETRMTLYCETEKGQRYKSNYILFLICIVRYNTFTLYNIQGFT